LTQFESGKSTIRYLPANGTAASDRSAVRTLSALLSPPAKINASVRSIVVSIRQGDKETRRNRTRLSPCLAFPLSPCLRDLENRNHPWGGVEGAPRGYPGPPTLGCFEISESLNGVARRQLSGWEVLLFAVGVDHHVAPDAQISRQMCALAHHADAS